MNRRTQGDIALDGLLRRAVALEDRLRRLRDEATGSSGLLRWVAHLLVRGGPLPARPVLTQLCAGLSRLGIHTLADAQLLRRALDDARAQVLAGRLVWRCRRALTEAERALRQVERASHRGGGAAHRGELEDQVSSLVRVLRLVVLLREPAVPLFPEEARRGRPAPTAWDPVPPAVSFTTPRLAIAAAFEARARRGAPAPGPRRRELEVAHALLLEVEPEAAERAAGLQLRWRVVQAKEALARQGTAEDPAGLLREVRALARRDPATAHQRLWGFQHQARLNGRDALGDAAVRALEVLSGPSARWGPDAAGVAEAFGIQGEEALGLPLQRQGGQVDALTVALFGQSFGRDPERTRLIAFARSASNFVGVEPGWGGRGDLIGTGAPFKPARAEWPSRRLEIERTGAPGRARDFIIEDPRRMLLDLAASRQAVRAFVEPASTPAPHRRSCVRVHVCDASASMQGMRSRFRDALLLAELESVLLREHRGLPVDPFYYFYFTDRPGPLQRVEDGSAALHHVERLLATTPASGRTDITRALLAAFDAIALARGRDPALAAASVVLVTDGEDLVDPSRILRAREPLGALPISLSFVALGQENPALRELARSQRAQGQRTFYVHLNDPDLRWAGEAFSAPVRSLIPEHWNPATVDTAALEPFLVALEQVAAGEAVTLPPTSDAGFDARFPSRPRRPVTAGIRPVPPWRVMGILEALEATAALLPLERRAAECVWLLDHLLALHGEHLPAWQVGLAEAGTGALRAVGRLRLLARRPGRRAHGTVRRSGPPSRQEGRHAAATD